MINVIQFRLKIFHWLVLQKLRVVWVIIVLPFVTFQIFQSYSFIIIPVKSLMNKKHLRINANCLMKSASSGGSRIFQTTDDKSWIWGKNLLFGNIFAENCMKIKDIRRGGGGGGRGRVPGAANGWFMWRPVTFRSSLIYLFDQLTLILPYWYEVNFSHVRRAHTHILEIKEK